MGGADLVLIGTAPKSESAALIGARRPTGTQHFKGGAVHIHASHQSDKEPSLLASGKPWFGLPFGRDGRVHPTRAPFEFYPTPPEATRALLSVEDFDGATVLLGGLEAVSYRRLKFLTYFATCTRQ